MKILLSYSFPHFNPGRPEDTKNKYWGSSANVLARSIYRILSELGEVTYVDPDDFSAANGKKFDLFVGQIRNFKKITEACSIKQSVLFAVNMHPKERNKILIKYAKKHRLPKDAIQPGDLVNVKDYEASIKVADYIISIGNIQTYNSYIRNGVPRRKIKIINYSVGNIDLSARQDESSMSQRKFVYVATALGLRKGFDCIVEAIEELHRTNKKFHLDIIGDAPKAEHYKKKLDKLLKSYKTSISYHGWVNVSSKKYKDILSAADFLLFPALEEAQAGSVLDAMRYGVIPIISKNTCNDFSPLGWFDADSPIKERLGILNKALSMSPDEIRDLREKTVEYYKLCHEPYMENLEATIKGAIRDELYPKMSVVLPIFNKEKVILSLIEHLDRAAKVYGNTEVNIIFDGCTDNSEKIVKKYYSKSRGYQVTFQNTPDIFEVKTNNIGLRKSTGKYSAVIQDDIFIYDPTIFFEAVTFMDKAPKVAILGGLAGVNFYPLGTQLEGPGQISSNEIEAYWRQDEDTDPELKQHVFEVDAAIRGPLIFRIDYLKQCGYLDEAYAPLHQDDIDICFRARKDGYRVYCTLMDVANKSLTTAHYDEGKSKFFADNLRAHLKLFYSRWKPSTEKNYLRINRVAIWRGKAHQLHYKAERLVRRAT